MQTSPISLQEIKARNSDWEEVGVTTLWVFAGFTWVRYIGELIYLNKTLRGFINTGFYIFERGEVYRVSILKYIRTKTVDKDGWRLKMPLYRYEKDKMELKELMGVVV